MSGNKKRIVIVGATSAIAEHCARLWVKDAVVDMTLVGRDPGRTERVAADLRVRSPQSVIRVLEANFTDPLAIRLLVDGIVAEGAIHTVLIAHGSLPDQTVCQQDLTACHDALTINGISLCYLLRPLSDICKRPIMAPWRLLAQWPETEGASRTMSTERPKDW